MKEFAAADVNRSPGDVFEAAAIAPVAITKHRKRRFVVMSMEQYEHLTEPKTTQVAVSVVDMPEESGDLLDKGLEDHFNGN